MTAAQRKRIIDTVKIDCQYLNSRMIYTLIPHETVMLLVYLPTFQSMWREGARQTGLTS